jgi:carboxypeptidase C (cathepsin A)
VNSRIPCAILSQSTSIDDHVGSIFKLDRNIVTLLNSEYIRKLIRTDEQPTSFVVISRDVNSAFKQSGDVYKSVGTHVAGLLERGVRALIYAGSTDLICPWLSVDRATRTTEWSGQDDFGKVQMREWELNGMKAGKVRTMGPLTFASIYDAGHMVSLAVLSSLARGLDDLLGST